MQQRVAFSGRPVVEPNGQQPLSGHVLDTAVAAAGPQVLVWVPVIRVTSCDLRILMDQPIESISSYDASRW